MTAERKDTTTMIARPVLTALTLLAAICGACASPGPYIWVNNLTPQETPDEPVIQPRDTILVEVKNQTSMSGEFTVREDGHYTQPLLGSIPVGGATPSTVAQTLSGMLRGMVNDARVMVWISRPAPIRVNVVGEVKTPGTFELTRDRTMLGALSAAGWVTEFAKKEGVYVVRMADKARIRFRLTDVSSPTGPATRFRLRDGDAVIVE